jgi:hypothetical protein
MASSKINPPNVEEDEILLFGDDHLELGDASVLDEEAILGGDDFAPSSDNRPVAGVGGGGKVPEPALLIENPGQEELNYDEDESPTAETQQTHGEVEASGADREDNEEGEDEEERQRSRESRFTSERTAPLVSQASQAQKQPPRRYPPPPHRPVDKFYIGTSAPRGGGGGTKCYINPNFKGSIPGEFLNFLKFPKPGPCKPKPFPANIVASLQQGSYVSPQALQAQQYGTGTSKYSYNHIGQQPSTAYIRPASTYSYTNYQTAPHPNNAGVGFAPPAPGAFQYGASSTVAHNPQAASQASNWSSMVDAFVKRASRVGESRGEGF